jgi:hypothetical protein
LSVFLSSEVGYDYEENCVFEEEVMLMWSEDESGREIFETNSKDGQGIGECDRFGRSMDL